MTFQIFNGILNHRVFVIALFVMASVSIHAQQSSQEDMLNLVAKLKRIEAMQPDSVQPKYQLAPQTENMIAEAEQTILQLSEMKAAAPSDICTLRGFLYMVRIVQNPAQNGQRYYLDVMQNYEKALKLNPDNQLAQQLQKKFLEGMQQARGGQ